MSDNTYTNFKTFASDFINGVHHQRVKIQSGEDGEALDVSFSNPLPATKGQQTVFTATIVNGTKQSAAVDLGTKRLFGLVTPADLTQTSMTFQTSYDGTTWNDLYLEDGNLKTITIGPSRRIALTPADFYSVRYIKISTNSNVTADRVFQLVAEG